MTLVDDPTDPTGYGAARCDAEGPATRRNLSILIYTELYKNSAAIPGTEAVTGYKTLGAEGFQATTGQTALHAFAAQDQVTPARLPWRRHPQRRGIISSGDSGYRPDRGALGEPWILTLFPRAWKWRVPRRTCQCGPVVETGVTQTLDTRARRRRQPNRPAGPRNYAGVVGRFAALLGLVLALVLAVVLGLLFLTAALALCLA
ncbi:hypothetical protein ACIBCO_37450 [Streptomyces violascens]|uniref:hypothetical protein n=1 Tax=Streptomyces violascens TaxID=67381 RepID=UPI0037A24385